VQPFQAQPFQAQPFQAQPFGHPSQQGLFVHAYVLSYALLI
jgi:hypothetical protein